MSKFWKTYKSTIILIVAFIIGTIIGLVFKKDATILKPLGVLFVNLLCVLIVPLIFLNITTAISKVNKPKRLSKLFGSIILVFVITSLASVIIGYLSTQITPLASQENIEYFEENEFGNEEEEAQKAKAGNDISVGERVVNFISVNDFSKLLSRENIMALLLMSVIVGVAINKTGEKADPLKKVLLSANDVMNRVIKIIMLYAPIGICCYIATVVGDLGGMLVLDLLKTFVIYLVVCLLYFFLMYTLFAFIGGGKKGVAKFWRHVWPAAATALGTCSSAASIPVNIDTCKKIGISDDVCETTVPLGTSFHKDGSIIGSAFKIMFLVCLLGVPAGFPTGILGALAIMGISLLANLLIMAIPVGGGVSEIFIVTMMGFPYAAVPLLYTIADIIDAPATMLNVVGDDVSSMMVARIVDGKNWIDSKEENNSEG